MGSWKCAKCGNTTAGMNKPLVGNCAKGGGHRCGKCSWRKQH